MHCDVLGSEDVDVGMATILLPTRDRVTSHKIASSAETTISKPRTKGYYSNIPCLA
jgi:hypothetical protein